MSTSKQYINEFFGGESEELVNAKNILVKTKQELIKKMLKYIER